MKQDDDAPAPTDSEKEPAPPTKKKKPSPEIESAPSTPVDKNVVIDKNVIDEPIAPYYQLLFSVVAG